MIPTKTDAGRQALAQRHPDLQPRDRQLLVLCDGKRDVATLRGLCGAETATALARLVAQRWVLMQAAGVEGAATARPTTASKPSASLAALSAPTSVATAPLQGQAVAIGAARSLASSKMYVLDQLARQRSAASDELTGRIHGCSDADALRDALVDALKLLAQQASAPYALRVAQRLQAIAPQDWLPTIESAIGVISEQAAVDLAQP